MTSTSAPAIPQSRPRPGPRAGVTATAWLMALGCLAFAAVNVGFEVTDRFADGRYAAYASGLTVANWLVVVLKVLGAAVALASVARRPRRVPPVAVNVLVWGAFATLGVYAVGSLAMAAGMATGVWGSADEIGTAGVAYVLLGLSAATGFGVLAVSHSRRLGLGVRPAALGMLAAPLVLGFVLVGLPALLVALGVMPAL